MASRDKRSGIVSREFARAMLGLVPVGVVFILLGQMPSMPRPLGRLIIGIGIFIVIYCVALSIVLFMLIRRRSR